MSGWPLRGAPGLASRWCRAAAWSAVAALAVVSCGSVAAPRQPPAAAVPPPELNLSVTAAGTSWAVVVMGGSSAQHDNFWQLFARPAGSASWRLATPAGVADNGGLVAAVTGPSSLAAGFRPSQDLRFSPLALTGNGGASWSTGNLIDPGLADVPDALAAGPGGQLLALTEGRGVQLGTRFGAAWSNLATVASLAGTGAGRACGLTGLTAAAFGASGGPLLAGGCARPGIAGIFALRGRTWAAAGPAIPAVLARRDVEVLRLATLGSRTQALLESGRGSAASLLAAWSGDGGARWLLSSPLRLGAATVRSASFGTGGAVGLVLAAGRGEALAGPGAAWRALPGLPGWTATLAVGPAGHIDALTARGAAFADWRLQAGPAVAPGAAGAPGAARWELTQRMHVTIPYGSSG